MEPDPTHLSHNEPFRHYLAIGGAAFILIGLAVLLDQQLKTGWLALVILPAIGVFLLVQGVRYGNWKLIVPGGLALGVGGGAFFWLGTSLGMNWQIRLGSGLLAFSAGWMAIAFLPVIRGKKAAWWAFFIGGIIASVAAAFLFGHLLILDFVLYIVTGLGLSFIVWGRAERLLGLIIPGCLLVGIGPGVAFAWGNLSDFNALSQTGVMLVWIALGWGLITVLSKFVTDKFIWWPLIPGGIFAVVGWGLYIGGNPDNALSFIGNTGSIGLIIFGVYLLLLRRGLRK